MLPVQRHLCYRILPYFTENYRILPSILPGFYFTYRFRTLVTGSYQPPEDMQMTGIQRNYLDQYQVTYSGLVLYLHSFACLLEADMNL